MKQRGLSIGVTSWFDKSLAVCESGAHTTIMQTYIFYLQTSLTENLHQLCMNHTCPHLLHLLSS